MTSSEEAEALLAEAKKRLNYARTSFEVEMFVPAASQAYYAVFYAAQAVIAYHRRSAKTHREVQNLFWTLAVKESDFPSKIAGIINTLEKGRLKAGYIALVEISEEEAAEAITQAETFVTEFTAWFHIDTACSDVGSGFLFPARKRGHGQKRDSGFCFDKLDGDVK